MLLAYLTPSKDSFLIAPSPDPLKQLTCFCWYNRPQTVSRFTFTFVLLQSTSTLTSTFTFYMAQLQLSVNLQHPPLHTSHVVSFISPQRPLARASLSHHQSNNQSHKLHLHHRHLYLQIMMLSLTIVAYILKASPMAPMGPGKKIIFRKFFCRERAKWSKVAQIWPKMAQSGPKMTQNDPKWPKNEPKWPKITPNGPKMTPGFTHFFRNFFWLKKRFRKLFHF